MPDHFLNVPKRNRAQDSNVLKVKIAFEQKKTTVEAKLAQ